MDHEDRVQGVATAYPPPQKPRVQSRTRNSITLSWDVPEDLGDDDAAAARSGQLCYELQRYYKPGGWICVYTGRYTTWEVTGLGPEKCYNFRLKYMWRQQQQSKESPWSPVLSAATLEGEMPATVLFRAIERGQAQAVRKALNSRPGVLHIYDRWGVLPLVRAAEKGDTQLVSLLLNSGAKVNHTCQCTERTALMMACFHGLLDVVRLLCERGASWSMKDRIGCTALHFAVVESHLEIARFAVKNGADLEAKDCHKRTPLMRGVTFECSDEMVEALLSLGADPNCRDDRKMTCLMYAALKGRVDVAAQLLAAGADRDAREENGSTALDIVRGSSLAEKFEALLVPEIPNTPDNNIA